MIEYSNINCMRTDKLMKRNGKCDNKMKRNVSNTLIIKKDNVFLIEFNIFDNKSFINKKLYAYYLALIIFLIII